MTLPTLMPLHTFKQLATVRDDLIKLNPASPSGEVAGILVPWAGERMRNEGGIYYVGIAAVRSKSE
jgi:hypothetical protein